MPKIKKTKPPKFIVGPDGTEYPIGIIDKQIVKCDQMVRYIIDVASTLSEAVESASNLINANVMGYLEEIAQDHGENWQGNTVLRTFDGKMTIEVDIQMQKSYDERLQVAGKMISTWLDKKLEFVADPAARKVFEQLQAITKTLLRIDHKGNVDQKKLNLLRKYDFADEPEWKEAMDLISASERITGTKRYLRFKIANPETGKLEGINVDFNRV
jgi:hypothetical protein